MSSASSNGDSDWEAAFAAYAVKAGLAIQIVKQIVRIQEAIDESDTQLGSPEMALKKMVAFVQLHEMAVEAGFGGEESK